MGGAVDEVASFFHVPADSSDPTRYGPTYVSPSGVIMSSFTVTPLPDAEDDGEPIAGGRSDP